MSEEVEVPALLLTVIIGAFLILALTYCYPTDIDQDARKTFGVCVCQEVVLP